MTDNFTTLADVLRGCSPGRLQSVGLMQIIPLVSNETEERIATLQHMAVRSTDYGTLRIRNRAASAPMIVPRDSGYITKRGAQDHALPQVAVVPAGRDVSFPNAACIQRSQGGLIEEGDHRLIILPFPMRQTAFLTRSTRSYQKLWEVISAFNRTMGIRDTGHVDVFLRQFGKQLERFVAEFEPVPNQVGAIVLVAGRIAGIERTPNETYWLEVWPALIRECYGSLALQAERAEAPAPDTRVRLEGEIRTLDDLEAAVERTEQMETERVAEIVRSLVAEPFTIESTEQATEGLTVETIKSDGFLGQTVKDGNRVLYASVTSTRERMSEPEELARAFTI